MALALQPPLRGDNIVIITNGGGSGLLSCDHFERRGMPMNELAEISEDSAKSFVNTCPSFGLRSIPWISLEWPPRGSTKQPLQIVSRTTVWMGYIGSVCPSAVTDVPAITSVAIMMHEKYRHLGKPFVMELQGGHECNEAIIELRAHGIPAYPTAEQGVNAFIALRKYFRIREAGTTA